MATVEPRMVSANAFRVWWMRLEELLDDVDAEPDLHRLYGYLYKLGRRAEATHLHITKGATSRPAALTVNWRRQLNPHFHWVAGEIDVSPLASYRPTDPEDLIEELVRVMGIKEHDTDTIPPMAKRMQENDEDPRRPWPRPS
jgi:hypothetical protein